MLIESDEALARAVAAAGALDPALARAAASVPPPSLRKREPDFAGLAAIVVGQQVSTASAAAILGRLKAALPKLDADAAGAASDAVLLGAGLSRPKLRTIRAVAEAVRSGRLRLRELGSLPAEEAHRALTAIHGIGPWTADVYLLFCLGHPDVFPAGDLALQEAAKLALGLESRPDARATADIARRWAPWRGGAAYLLWSVYRHARSRDGSPAVAAPQGEPPAVP